MKTPKNTPTSIFLDLGFESDNTDKEDFNECDEVTWSDTNATGNGVEYVRKNLVEEMAKDFTKLYIRQIGEIHGWDENGKLIPNKTMDELFEEFLTSRKAIKE